MDTDNTAGPTIAASKVEGTKVYNLQGETLGTIDELSIDKASGKVRYATLEFGGFLGMGTDRYPMPWAQLEYDTSKDGYVVDLDKGRLKDAPRYEQNARPEFNDQYGRKVYDYYGETWW